MHTTKKEPLNQDIHVKEKDMLDQSGVQPIEDKEKEKKMIWIVLGLALVVLVGGGILTGYFLGKPTYTGSTASTASGSGQLGKGFGSSDTKTFSDTTIGTIEKNGIDGEGTHRLIREGGDSQTACLVSSVLDLDEFNGKKVKVWSKTMAAKKCPWLMDVGRIEPQ